MTENDGFGGRRVLVVEDDVLIVAELVDRFYAMGADVVGPITSVEKAFDRLEKLPDIAGAVLDISVQGELIFPLAEELKARGVPYVFSSGYDDSVVPTQYSDVIRFSKPADECEIASTLLEAIRRRTSQSEKPALD